MEAVMGMIVGAFGVSVESSSWEGLLDMGIALEDLV